MKLLRLVCLLSLLSVSLFALYVPGTVLAQEPTLISEEEEKIEDKIEMSLTYPKLEAIAGQNFEFEVEFKYTGEGDREFDLRTTAPTGWDVYITPPYEKEKKIKSMRVKPSFTYGDKVRVVASPTFWPLPEPGEYNITFEAVSGELTGSIELKPVITAKYTLFVVPSLERYNTTAKAGEDNSFSINVQNLGTAPIDDIKFSSTKPDGWAIEFEPDKIDSLKAIDEQTIDVNIKPPPKTIAGDYQIKLRASGQQTSATEVAIRVTVETPTIWGWVGVGIILIVIIGLVIIFWRFSRR
ncbi:NEW3 domain-containing protein [Chloroflexota bacterium]